MTAVSTSGIRILGRWPPTVRLGRTVGFPNPLLLRASLPPLLMCLRVAPVATIAAAISVHSSLRRPDIGAVPLRLLPPVFATLLLHPSNT